MNFLDELVGAYGPSLPPSDPPVSARKTRLDSEWTKNSFMDLGSGSIDRGNKRSMLFASGADRKYTDTTMGGNIGMGGRPQFTRYSDTRSPGAAAGRSPVSISANDNGQHGMGRLYAEVYDNANDLVFMRFGVPQFTALSSFLTEFSDTETTKLATTGRSNSELYKAGELLGTFTIIIAAPVLSLSVFTVKGISTWYNDRRSSRFYMIKPTMHLYWSTVNMIINTLGVNRGLVKRVFKAGGGVKGNSFTEGGSMAQVLNAYEPDLITASGFIDVGLIANKAQRMSNVLSHHIGESNYWGDEGITTGDYVDANIQTDHTTFGTILNVFAGVDKWYTIDESLKNGYKSQYRPQEVHVNMVTKPETRQKVYEGDPGMLSLLQSSLRAEFNQGSQWAILRCNSIKSTTHSFSNSVKTNEIADKFNATTSRVRDVKFSFAGGNIGESPIANATEGILGGMADFLKGAASGLSFGFTDSMADLLAGVTMEMPKYWDAANAELGESQFSIVLVSPYNNVWSHMINIYVPLAMILAGVLPLKSGAQSHVSPFVCSCSNKGKSMIDLGMITSCNITHGVTNQSFDLAGHALSIKVDFSITNLAPVMSIPISTGKVFNGEVPGWPQADEDSAIFGYLASLAGMSIAEMGEFFDASNLRITRALNSVNHLASPATWALQSYEMLLANPITSLPARAIASMGENNVGIAADLSDTITGNRNSTHFNY
jgi:hypothetical protein